MVSVNPSVFYVSRGSQLRGCVCSLRRDVRNVFGWWHLWLHHVQVECCSERVHLRVRPWLLRQPLIRLVHWCARIARMRFGVRCLMMPHAQRLFFQLAATSARPATRVRRTVARAAPTATRRRLARARRASTTMALPIVPVSGTCPWLDLRCSSVSMRCDDSYIQLYLAHCRYTGISVHHAPKSCALLCWAGVQLATRRAQRARLAARMGVPRASRMQV